MFEDLPLDEFGNRIPPITAEIAWAGAPQAVVKDTTFLSGGGYFTGSAVLDSERGFLYFKTSPDGIGRIRTSGMVEDLRVPATELGIDLTGVKAIDSRGDLYVTHGITEQSFRKIDGDTLQVVASASFSSQVELATVSAYTLTGRIDFVLALGFLSAPARIFFADDLSVFWPDRTSPAARAAWSVASATSARARPGSRPTPRSCWAIRPPRSASCTSGWSCRSRSARSPAFPRP